MQIKQKLENLQQINPLDYISQMLPKKNYRWRGEKNGAKTESANVKIKAAEKAEGKDSEPNKVVSE